MIDVITVSKTSRNTQIFHGNEENQKLTHIVSTLKQCEPNKSLNIHPKRVITPSLSKKRSQSIHRCHCDRLLHVRK